MHATCSRQMEDKSTTSEKLGGRNSNTAAPYVAPSFNLSRLNILLSIHITEIAHFPHAVTFSWEHRAHSGYKKQKIFPLTRSKQGQKRENFLWGHAYFSDTRKIHSSNTDQNKKKVSIKQRGQVAWLATQNPNQYYSLLLTFKQREQATPVYSKISNYFTQLYTTMHATACKPTHREKNTSGLKNIVFKG